MIKKVCLVGHMGNMGRRYGRILDYLSIPYQGIDLVNYDSKVHDDVEGFIIATPTSSHYSDIMKYQRYGKPILCEKPITKNADEFYELMKLDCELSIVNQYRVFYQKNNKIKNEHMSHYITSYRYYNSGNDGLLWDCINLIGMADGDIHLTKKEHIWWCMLNGLPIDRGDIDGSYEDCISKWIYGEFVESKRFMIDSFEKVMKYEKESRGCNWNSGEEIFITATGKIYKAPLPENIPD